MAVAMVMALVMSQSTYALAFNGGQRGNSENARAMAAANQVAEQVVEEVVEEAIEAVEESTPLEEPVTTLDNEVTEPTSQDPVDETKEEGAVLGLTDTSTEEDEGASPSLFGGIMMTAQDITTEYFVDYYETFRKGGNVYCEDLSYLDGYYDESVRDLNFGLGSYDLVGGGKFEWTIANSEMDWTSSGALIYAVIIKGGTAARVYNYIPDGATSDSGLTPPLQEGSEDEYYGFSNLGFCYSPALMVEKTAKAEWTRTWDWEIEKTATPGGPVTLEVDDTATVEYDVKVSATSSVEFMVSGDITITNQTTNPITITSINDVISGGAGSDVLANDADIDCSTAWPDRTSSYVLPAGATLTCEYEVEVPAPDYTLNTVTVAAEDGMGGSATADFLFDTSKPTTEVDACVTVSDSNANFGGDKEVCVKDLDNEGVYAFTPYTVSFGYKADDVDVELVCGTQTYKNTATSTTIAGGVIDSSTVAIDMTVLCALDIEKTAKTEWTRTWDWNILKTATPGGPVTLAEGELATVDYTVAVSATSTLKFEVSGTVTVTNPHQSTVTVTDVKDVMTEYGPVALDCGAVKFDYELKGGESFICSYSVVVDNPNSRINTATVEVASDSVVSGATATTSVKFDTLEPTTEVDACVTVSDSNANFGEDKEVCADGLIDGKKVYTYSVTFGKDDGANVELECGFQSYENTAEVSKGDVVLAYSKVSIDMTVECALVCSWSQGYWFAKPGVVWPINIALGGNNYTQADGANIWNIKGRYAGSDAKVAFTQYTALVLSLEEQDGVDRTDLPTELQNALKVIENYFHDNNGKGMLSNSTISKYSRSAAVRKAASDISAWIELNHCDYLVDDTNNY